MDFRYNSVIVVSVSYTYCMLTSTLFSRRLAAVRIGVFDEDVCDRR